MGKNRAVGDTFDCRYFTATGQSVQIDYAFDAFFVTGGVGGITFLLNPHAVEGDTHLIADTGNTASGGNPIVITLAAGQTINGGGGSIMITVAGDAVQLTFNSSLGGWVAQSMAGGGSTPGSAPFPTFVFRPGGVAAAPNVYTSWAALQTAYALVAGPKWVQFDSTFAAIHIPAGAWSLEDATCVASVAGLTVTVTWDAGSSFSAAHLTPHGVTFVSDHTIFTGNASTRALWQFFAASNIQGSTATAPIAITDGELLMILYTSTLGDGTNPVINLLGTADCSFDFFDASIASDHWLTGANTASAFVGADGSSVPSQTTGGALVPTFQQEIVGANFVFQPGGTRVENIFPTWAEALTAMGLVAGPKILYIDDSIAPAHATAGTWDMQAVTLTANFNGTAAELIVDTGSVWTTNQFIVEGGLTLVSNSAASVVTIPAGSFNRFLVRQGSALSSTGAVAFFKCSNTGGVNSCIFEADDASYGDGVHAVVTVDAGASCDFVLDAEGQVSAAATAGAGTKRAVINASTAAVFDTGVTLANTTYPNLNTVQQTGNGGSPGHTIAVTTGNISAKRLGKMQVIGSCAGATAAADTITATLVRDVAGANTTIATQTVTTTAGQLNYDVGFAFIDTAPDRAAHTYSIRLSGAQNNTVGANQAIVSAIEL